MINTFYAVTAIVGMAAVTILLRALPFLAAPLLKRLSMAAQLGRFLPPAIMTLLVLHSVHGSASNNPAGLWQEGGAIGLAILLQLRWRSALLSIMAGTLLYVVLRNSHGFN